MAHHIRNAPGTKIVAVVGAAHLPGILRRLREETSPQQIAEISVIPEKSTVSKAIPWAIPSVVMALFVAGFFLGDRERVAGAAVACRITSYNVCYTKLLRS